MAYDGKILRRATARYDEDKQRRAEAFRARQRICYSKEPRLEEIDRELSHTMAKIIASGFRRGTDPRGAIEALKSENLQLQRERGELLCVGCGFEQYSKTPFFALSQKRKQLFGHALRCADKLSRVPEFLGKSEQSKSVSQRILLRRAGKIPKLQRRRIPPVLLARKPSQSGQHQRRNGVARGHCAVVGVLLPCEQLLTVRSVGIKAAALRVKELL